MKEPKFLIYYYKNTNLELQYTCVNLHLLINFKKQVNLPDNLPLRDSPNCLKKKKGGEHISK